ncbi:MAG: lysine--tRNA ligase [Deltaproteobacteria bacterium]|jgi:lysyl-tRNA synthetase class 2|nr:lysine--tRNA ligase [Deltaproteobacteria bacterium]
MEKNPESQDLLKGQGESNQELSERGSFIQARIQKALDLVAAGIPIHPNTFRPEHSVESVRAQLGELSSEELVEKNESRKLAGRLMAKRDYGKSIFFDLLDSTGKIQIYARQDKLTAETYELVKKFDLGDIVGLSGLLFKTKTGELTVSISQIELITKNMWPLAEKYHEMNVELKYRRRYLDLIMNEDSRRVFKLRIAIIQSIRDFMLKKAFLEVETPMLHPIPSGATAKPFITHHNALDLDLYLRVAPELYLKRLLVGGFDRVFEINRSYRNEGISVQHNPEFTMMEFYQAYANYFELMDFTEELFENVALECLKTTKISYQGQAVDLTRPWKRISFADSLVEVAKMPREALNDRDLALKFLAGLGVEMEEEKVQGKILAKIFDLAVEPTLLDPTFVTLYPADISPLARRNDQDPTLTDRFELFVVGRELANAFSELNDPLDQRKRFLDQMQERADGDEESMVMDEDYVRALMYGMPPAAGEGVGIDRLVMLLADVPSIKDVLFFPLLRPEDQF